MAIQKLTKLHGNLEDLSGQSFGRLTVISGSYENRKWSCRCECGQTARVAASHLKDGNTKSCGCYAQECRVVYNTKHGMTRTRTWRIWTEARRRCFDPNRKAFKDYGGRGITMCPKWANSFQQFFEDMGPCPDGYSIERVNNNGNYEPGNCKWIPRTDQQRNKRNLTVVDFHGERLTLRQVSERTGIPYTVLRSRRDQGWKTPIEAPVRIWKTKKNRNHS